WLQVRRLAWVVEEVHPANNAHDAAAPGFGLSSEDGRRLFAGQHVGQLLAEHAAFVVQMLLAERIRECHDGVAGVLNRWFTVLFVGHRRLRLRTQAYGIHWTWLGTAYHDASPCHRATIGSHPARCTVPLQPRFDLPPRGLAASRPVGQREVLGHLAFL